MSSNDQITILLKVGDFKNVQLSGGEDTPLKVVKIDSRSPAHKKGLQQGDVLVSINKVNLRGKSQTEALKLIDNAKNAIVILVTRGGSSKVSPAKKQKLTEVQSTDKTEVQSTDKTEVQSTDKTEVQSTDKTEKTKSVQKTVTEGIVSVKEVTQVVSSETTVSGGTESRSSETLEAAGGFTLTTSTEEVTSTTFDDNKVESSSQLGFTITASVEEVTTSDKAVPDSDLVVSADVTIEDSQTVPREDSQTVPREDSQTGLSAVSIDAVNSENVVEGSELVISADVTIEDTEILSSEHSQTVLSAVSSNVGNSENVLLNDGLVISADVTTDDSQIVSREDSETGLSAVSSDVVNSENVVVGSDLVISADVTIEDTEIMSREDSETGLAAVSTDGVNSENIVVGSDLVISADITTEDSQTVSKEDSEIVSSIVSEDVANSELDSDLVISADVTIEDTQTVSMEDSQSVLSTVSSNVRSSDNVQPGSDNIISADISVEDFQIVSNEDSQNALSVVFSDEASSESNSQSNPPSVEELSLTSTIIQPSQETTTTEPLRLDHPQSTEPLQLDHPQSTGSNEKNSVTITSTETVETIIVESSVPEAASTPETAPVLTQPDSSAAKLTSTTVTAVTCDEVPGVDGPKLAETTSTTISAVGSEATSSVSSSTEIVAESPALETTSTASSNTAPVADSSTLDVTSSESSNTEIVAESPALKATSSESSNTAPVAESPALKVTFPESSNTAPVADSSTLEAMSPEASNIALVTESPKLQVTSPETLNTASVAESPKLQATIPETLITALVAESPKLLATSPKTLNTALVAESPKLLATSPETLNTALVAESPKLQATIPETLNTALVTESPKLQATSPETLNTASVAESPKLQATIPETLITALVAESPKLQATIPETLNTASVAESPKLQVPRSTDSSLVPVVVVTSDTESLIEAGETEATSLSTSLDETPSVASAIASPTPGGETPVNEIPAIPSSTPVDGTPVNEIPVIPSSTPVDGTPGASTASANDTTQAKPTSTPNDKTNATPTSTPIDETPATPTSTPVDEISDIILIDPTQVTASPISTDETSDLILIDPTQVTVPSKSTDETSVALATPNRITSATQPSILWDAVSATTSPTSVNETSVVTATLISDIGFQRPFDTTVGTTTKTSSVVAAVTTSSQVKIPPNTPCSLPLRASTVLTSPTSPQATSKLYDVTSFVTTLLPTDEPSTTRRSRSRDRTFDITYSTSPNSQTQFTPPSWRTHDESKITMTHSTRIINLNTVPSFSTDNSPTYIPPTDTTRALNDLLNDPLIVTKPQASSYIAPTNAPSFSKASPTNYSKPQVTVSVATRSSTNDTWRPEAASSFRPTKFTPGPAKEKVGVQTPAPVITRSSPNDTSRPEGPSSFRPTRFTPVPAKEQVDVQITAPVVPRSSSNDTWRPHSPPNFRPTKFTPRPAREPAVGQYSTISRVEVETENTRPKPIFQVAHAVSGRAPEVWSSNTWGPGHGKRQVTSQVSSFSSYPSVSQVQGNFSRTDGQNVARTTQQAHQKGIPQISSYQDSLQNETHSYDDEGNIRETHSYDDEGNIRQQKLRVFGPPVEIRPEIGVQTKRYATLPDRYQHDRIYDELSGQDSFGMRDQNLNSYRGRGGRLFERRKKRSDKFIIDDTTVKAAAPSTKLDAILSQPSRNEMTPWKAAIAHGGNVDAAFSSLSEWEAVQRHPVNRNLTDFTQQQPAFRSTLKRDESPGMLKNANFNRTARGWSVDRETRFDHRSLPRQPVAIETAQVQPDSYRQEFHNKMKTWHNTTESAYTDIPAQRWPVRQQDNRENYYTSKTQDYRSLPRQPVAIETAQVQPDSYRQDFHNKMKTWHNTTESAYTDIPTQRWPVRQQDNRENYYTSKTQDDSLRHSPPRQAVAIETAQVEPDSYREHFNNKLKIWQNISESAETDIPARNWPVQQQQDNRESYYGTNRQGQWSRTPREETSHLGNWSLNTYQVPLSRSWHSGSQISPRYGNEIDWSGYYNSPVAYRQPIIPGTDL